ncbi:MAG TPA: hypothetical protein VHA52_13120 [Candidatus Babeliaceae bacterium]|nr:hypothetical protein [Candidatus Babeliaceae bacterium]
MINIYRFLPAILLLVPACGGSKQMPTESSTVTTVTEYKSKERISGPMADETIAWDAEDME